MTKLRDCKDHRFTLWWKGDKLAAGLRNLISKHQLTDIITVDGIAPWTLLGFHDASNGVTKDAVKTLLMIEMLRRGALISGSHNLCYAHNADDMAQVLRAYDDTLASLSEAISAKDVERRLDGPVIRPVFTVRG